MAADANAPALLAPAKINLTLHVVGQRADGYHLLDSLVMFADISDRLRLEPGPEMRLRVHGPFAAGVPLDQRNLVWRAAQYAGWTGSIELIKNLPHGAGIGGGSSDCAALLRALGHTAHAEHLGADVPVCLLARAAHMREIGQQVNLVPDMPVLAAVLVNPDVHISTPKVFAALDRKTNPPMQSFPPKGSAAPIWHDWLRAQRNDLQDPAIHTAPQIGAALAALRTTSDVCVTRMSGSGGTCFGLYPSEPSARAAAHEIQMLYPHWWCVHTTLS